MEEKVKMTNFLMLIQKLVSSNSEILNVVNLSVTNGEVIGISPEKAENVKRVVRDIKELTRLAKELEGHVEIYEKSSR
jgi:hypothetical protein